MVAVLLANDYNAIVWVFIVDICFPSGVKIQKEEPKLIPLL